MASNLDIIIGNIINDMIPILDNSQLESLYNTLYLRFHNYVITEESTELAPLSIDNNEMKIRMFIASKKVMNLSEKTLKRYDWVIHNMLNFLQKNIEDITAMDIRYYIAYLREFRKVTSNTIKGYMECLSSFFSFLEVEGVIIGNPVKQVGPIKVEKIIKQPFSAEELEKLRLACTNDRDRALIEFLYATGVRVSECSSLNISNINFAKNELIVFGKESKERRVYLTDTARFYLCKYLETRKNKEDFANQPLFVSLKAPYKRLSKDGIEYALRNIGKRAGVDNCYPHRFRRTIATDLLNRGMPVEQVKEFLGHERVDTTMIYCTVSDESVKASYRKFA